MGTDENKVIQFNSMSVGSVTTKSERTTYCDVSIIIPVQNEGSYLLNTLRSIEENVGAPLTDYEIILVDDHSTDNAFELVEKATLKSTIRILKLQGNDKGPGVARQRGIEASTREFIFTCDSHMAFPQNFLKDFRALSFKYPDSILIGASTGFRSVKDWRTHEMPKCDITDIADYYRVLDEEWHQPIVIELPEKHQDLKQSLREQLKCTLNFSKTPRPILHVKGWELDPEMKDPFQSWGCRLKYDPGDRNFFTPKWNPAFRKSNPPSDKTDVIPVSGLMGASYFMRRQLLLDKIGGWTQYQGWVHEEEYLSVAAQMTGTPIFCARNIMIAHNYDRYSVTMQNTENMKLNKYAILEICFNELKADMYRKLFKLEDGDPKVVHPDWVYEYQNRVQAHKVMTDREFLENNGFSIFFDDKTRKETSNILGASSTEPIEEQAKTMNLEAMFKVMEGWHNNRGIKSLFITGVFQNEPKGFMKVEADRNDFSYVVSNLYDDINKCRSTTMSRIELNHLLGLVNSVVISESMRITGSLDTVFNRLVKHFDTTNKKQQE